MALDRILWENRSHSGSTGRVAGEVVSEVRYLQTHTATNSNIYSVEVRGKPLPGRFRYKRDARVAAERAWAEIGEDHG